VRAIHVLAKAFRDIAHAGVDLWSPRSQPQGVTERVGSAWGECVPSGVF